jgi:secreted PhoX family phosphatase
MSLDRRTLLKSAAAASLAGPFAGLVASPAEAAKPEKPKYPLLPVADQRDDVVRLHLPPGFNYRSFHDTTTTVVLTDGTVLPGRHDGMGAFPGTDGRVTLVRNHEVNGPGPAFSTAAPVYDPFAQGGTTTIDVDHHGMVAGSSASLAGTQMNCSGGIMPWGSWVTCEETVNGPDVGPDFTGVPNIALTEPHGYVFEVPLDGLATGEPIRSAGRFAHEAVSFDPVDGYLYLTEDNFEGPSGFYRYLPPRHPMEVGRIEDGGQLQMLRVIGKPNALLVEAQAKNASFDVDWVDIDDPSPTFPFTPGQTALTSNSTAISYVASQGIAQGAAKFSRLEGQVYEKGTVFFCSTQGGGEVGPNPTLNGYGTGFGQVWAYNTKQQKLRLVFQSPGRAVLDFPDNITTSRGGSLVICEDHDEDNYIRGLTSQGRISDIALNRMPGRASDEFAGSTFSPDGSTLFVNIQANRGLTFAIWGPWDRIGV